MTPPHAAALVAGVSLSGGEFHRLSCRAEAAEALVQAVVSGLGLKQKHVTPADVKEVIAGLQAEAELYRRGYHLIGACDIGNYLARCAEAGETSEV